MTDSDPSAKPHAIVIYREAETVLAFRVDADPKHFGSQAMAIELADSHFPSVFNPLKEMAAQPNVRTTYLEEIRAGRVKEGDWAVLDPIKGNVRDSVSDPEFIERYEPLSASNGWFATKGGKEIQVGIHNGCLVDLNGGTIRDPVAFSQGRVRSLGAITCKADEAIALQVVRAVQLFDQPGISEHVAHISFLASNIVFSYPLPPTVVADALFVDAVAKDPDILPASVQAPMMSGVAYSIVFGFAAQLPPAAGFNELCKATRLPLAAWRLKECDNSELWNEFEPALRRLSVKVGKRLRIGEGAFRLISPTVLDSPVDEWLKSGRTIASDGTQARLIERDGVQFLVSVSSTGRLAVVGCPDVLA